MIEKHESSLIVLNFCSSMLTQQVTDDMGMLAGFIVVSADILSTLCANAEFSDPVEISFVAVARQTVGEFFGRLVFSQSE